MTLPNLRWELIIVQQSSHSFRAIVSTTFGIVILCATQLISAPTTDA